MSSFQQQQNGAFRRVWYMQDGAPAHRALSVRNRLQELFDNYVVGMGHQIDWPARSPDLSPLDFYLWGTVKSLAAAESHHWCIQRDQTHQTGETCCSKYGDKSSDVCQSSRRPCRWKSWTSVSFILHDMFNKTKRHFSEPTKPKRPFSGPPKTKEKRKTLSHTLLKWTWSK